MVFTYDFSSCGVAKVQCNGNLLVAGIFSTEARKRLYALIDEVGDSHEPVQITGKR